MNISEIQQTVREVVQKDPKQVVRSVSLFGSQITGATHPLSDIDLLVELIDSANLFDVGHLQYELELRLKRPVDLVTAGSLSKYFRQHVRDQAIKLYG